MLVRISIKHSPNGFTFLGKFFNSYHRVAIAMRNEMQLMSKKSGRVEIWRELNESSNKSCGRLEPHDYKSTDILLCTTAIFQKILSKLKSASSKQKVTDLSTAICCVQESGGPVDDMN